MPYCKYRNVKERGRFLMDIASLSTALSTTQLQNDVGVLMLSKQLDTVEVMSDSMIKMMEQSVNPNLGANIDISI